MRRRPVIVTAALLYLAALPARAEFLPSPPAAVFDVPTRPGVTVRYAAIKPDGAPQAVALLLVGGQGLLRIPDQPGPNWQNPGNFLSRSRENFRRRGFYVAVVDSPSDHPRGMISNFRSTADHAADLAAVIADLRRRVPGVPLWVIGTSRGTVSAANLAARVPGAAGPDGVVLTSSVTRPAEGVNAPSRDSVFDSDLAQIRIPALVLSHKYDACQVTPPADATRILGKLTNSPHKEVILVEGGDAPRGDPCEAYAAHGYVGMEDQAVGTIASWIQATR